MDNIVRVKKRIIVNNAQGLHARPAAVFVQVANKFNAKIDVRKGSQTVNGKSIMSILTLAVERGTEVIIIAEGEDAHNAVTELEKVLNSNE